MAEKSPSNWGWIQKKHVPPLTTYKSIPKNPGMSYRFRDYPDPFPMLFGWIFGADSGWPDSGAFARWMVQALADSMKEDRLDLVGCCQHENGWLGGGFLLKMYFLLKMGKFHCHVSLLECNNWVVATQTFFNFHPECLGKWFPNWLQ